MNTSKLSKLLIWRFHLFTQCFPTLHPTWQFNNWRGTTPGRHQTWFVTSMTRRASHGAIYARHMKSCQLWGLATSAHSKDKKISMEETKRNQKKPKETSFTGLVKGKFTGNPWVFTMKYRVFLWIFPIIQFYDSCIFTVKLWRSHFSSTNVAFPGTKTHQRLGTNLRPPSAEDPNMAWQVVLKISPIPNMGKLDMDNSFCGMKTQFLWPNFYD